MNQVKYYYFNAFGMSLFIGGLMIMFWCGEVYPNILYYTSQMSVYGSQLHNSRYNKNMES